jgi:glycosyltransferase involved in cell wall biosynthesis
MHFVLAMAGLPAYGNHGGAQTCMGIVKAMLKKGHKVTVLSFYDESDWNPYLPHRYENEETLKVLGVNIEYINYNHYNLIQNCSYSKLKKIFNPSIADIYYWYFLRNVAREKVALINPDAIFCYHFEPLAALFEQIQIPMVAGIGDPTHTPSRAWCNAIPWQQFLRRLKAEINAMRIEKITVPMMKRMLSSCKRVGAFAAHYADWLKTVGFNDARYFQSPIADPLENKDWRKERENNRQNLKVPKILMIGDLTGTATRLGLILFAEKVLPVLTKLMGNNPFEVHIVGRGEPPANIAEILQNHPAIKLRGRIDPADKEFLSADCLFVPTPIDLGIRVRILTAFSFACPVIAHPANAAGIKELKNNDNCLLGSDGQSLAEALYKVITDTSLRQQLEKNGRQCFENFFLDEVAGARIVELMEAL